MNNTLSQNLARLTALVAALFCAVLAPAQAQTIENTATVEWDAGTTRVSRPSNRVELNVNRPPATSATLKTYQFAPNGGAGQQINVPKTMCQGQGGTQPVSLHGAFAGLSTSPATVEPTHRIRAGEPLIVAVTSPSDNLNPNAVDTKEVTLKTPSGDSEVLTLSESGPNTGVFVGIINTSAIPPQPVKGDCRLSLYPGESLTLAGVDTATGSPIATAPLDVLIDPFGIVFDSGDGTPVAGVRVTLIDVATGQPAEVFGDDGVSRFPSSVVTGSTVTDSGGNIYRFPLGDYRFPFARPGRYRLVVEPPAPYSAPSKSSPADLAGFRRPDGPPYTIVPGSFSDIFTLNDPAPVRIDIPIDRPGAPLVLRKSASQPVAAPGDTVQYRLEVRNADAARATGAITITDDLPREMRLKAGTVRYNGNLSTYSVSNDGRRLTISLPALAPGRSGIVTYILEVRPDAKPGQSLNRAQAQDNRGTTSPVSDATVRITRDGISDRMTIIGRVTDGGCSVDPRAANGVPGVRVMLEDGSYAVTDLDGRYHFEGVKPGTHVVQIESSTLPSGQIPAKCVNNARSGDSAISRFVDGRGSALIRVDFSTTAGENKARLVAEQVRREKPQSSAEAAAADRDWLNGQQPGVEWLFPEPDHNPRTKAVRVAIKHIPGHTVKLFANGQPVGELAFDGVRTSADGQVAVSTWRAVPIEDRKTRLTAEIFDANGQKVTTLERAVHFSASPLNATFIKSKSNLIADGVTRPVIAVRFTDRDGRPVRQGMTGDFSVPAPYYPAVETDAQNARHLSGLERARPVWHVEGDDGIAYIELEPTTASGTLTLTLPLRDGDVARTQRVDLWLDPGKRPWTVVGFAAGTLGFNTLDDNLEQLGPEGETWYSDARVALYAKGRVKGKWLLTLAYDSDKPRDDTRFGGVIDPEAYYTVYADRTERRYDAKSERRLYVKLERPQFYALFGDYETNIVEPQLARYNRSFNGVKAEFRNENLGATSFAADTPYRHRREEIQGNGLSGPYALASRDILPNSERITIETRDRMRPERIIDSRVLVRHIDYDIDYVSGTIRFREPILSRSSGFDPQFIIADYEVDGVAQRVVNAGGRVTWNNDSKSLQIAATAIHNEDDVAKTDLAGVDVRYRPDENTEIRAEFALSDRTNDATASTLTNPGTSTAWLVEAEHHGAQYDLLAYARQEDTGFGVDQLNGVTNGTRKFGIDGRARINKNLSLTGSYWHDDYLGTQANRDAAKATLEYRSKVMDLRVGVAAANDTFSDGRVSQSTVAQLGATRRFFSGKLELDAQSEFSLDGKKESIDFPARHKLGARYHFNSDIALVGSYEIAKGDAIDARTARIGFDVKPWTGGHLLGSMNQQDIGEFGPRTYAAFGLAQSLPIGKRWAVDFTLDANKTIGGFDANNVLTTQHPSSSGGFLAGDSVLTEDFTAVTAGASYRGDRWSWTGRAEARSGTLTHRYGLTTAVLRQVGEGQAMGGQFSYFNAADNKGGPRTEAASLTLSWGHRPSNSNYSFLEKLELRSDRVKGAVFGETGPIGGAPLLISGNAKSQRIVNSFSFNWSPVQRQGDGSFMQRSEISVFWGSRYVFDRYGEDDIKGWSNVFGADVRFDLGKFVDVGFSGTVRQNPGNRAYSWAGGPQISISPFDNGYITLGYNIVGFRDKDFEDSRYTQSGPYVTVRLKFDQNSLGSLGLGTKN